MTSNLSLDVQTRSILGKKVKKLRQQGLMPATVYGKNFKPIAIQIDEHTFNFTYRKAGRTQLVQLNIPGHKKQSVFIHTIQRHPVSRAILHADFYVVDLYQAINIEVPVVLVGVSPVVKRGDALTNQILNSVEVHAFPTDLPQHIEVDISSLDALDKGIYVRDLPLTGNYSYVTDVNELVVSLQQLRADSADEKETADMPMEPELIRKERKSEDK